MRQRHNKIVIVATLSVLLALSSNSFAQNSPPTASESLKLLISLKQTFVAPPDAPRIVLHLHNSTPQPLWLYRRAKGKKSAEELTDSLAVKVGGSTLELRLLPVDSTSGSVVTASGTTVLEYAQMPKPRLVKVEPDGDYEETAIVQLRPALAAGEQTNLGGLSTPSNLCGELSKRRSLQGSARGESLAGGSFEQCGQHRNAPAASRLHRQN